MTRVDLDRPCRVMVAPNEARRQKAVHAALPITPAEVAGVAVNCRKAGATAIHLRARDANGAHTLEPEIYARYIGAVREAVGDGFFIQVTTEAVGRYNPAEQMAAIRALPVLADGVSLALCKLLPEHAPTKRRAGLSGLAQRCRDPAADHPLCAG